MEQPFKQLHSLRKSRKLKQEDVAKMAGISREAYLRAESGRADPRLSTLMAVAGALGLEVVLAPREAVAEIERVIASHPTQPLQGGGAGDAGHERSEHGSMGGTGGAWPGRAVSRAGAPSAVGLSPGRLAQPGRPAGRAACGQHGRPLAHDYVQFRPAGCRRGVGQFGPSGIGFGLARIVSPLPRTRPARMYAGPCA